MVQVPCRIEIAARPLPQRHSRSPGIGKSLDAKGLNSKPYTLQSCIGGYVVV